MAFELVTYATSRTKGQKGKFTSFDLPESVGRLEAKIKTENEDGEYFFQDVPLIDCKILYPDLITEGT